MNVLKLLILAHGSAPNQDKINTKHICDKHKLVSRLYAPQQIISSSITVIVFLVVITENCCVHVVQVAFLRVHSMSSEMNNQAPLAVKPLRTKTARKWFLSLGIHCQYFHNQQREGTLLTV